MSGIKIVMAARADLRMIRDLIAADHPRAAARYLEGIHRTFQHLADWPMSGRSRDEYRPGLRSFVHREHLIFYRPSSGGITVLRVLHGRRDLERVFHEA